MSTVMLGTEVAKTMKEELIRDVELLKGKGIHPCLAIIRVGARGDDLAYERSAKKRMEMVGIDCKVVELPKTISQENFERAFAEVNDDPKVDGILLFRPLPEGLDCPGRLLVPVGLKPGREFCPPLGRLLDLGFGLIGLSL